MSIAVDNPILVRTTSLTKRMKSRLWIQNLQDRSPLEQRFPFLNPITVVRYIS